MEAHRVYYCTHTLAQFLNAREGAEGNNVSSCYPHLLYLSCLSLPSQVLLYVCLFIV